MNALESVSGQEEWTLQHMGAAEDYAGAVLRGIGVESYLIDDLAQNTAQEATLAIVRRLDRGGPIAVEVEDDLRKYWKQVLRHKAKELRADQRRHPRALSLDIDIDDDATISPVIVGVDDPGFGMVDLVAHASPRRLLRRALLAQFRAGVVGQDGSPPLSVKESANVNAGRVMAVALAVVAEFPEDDEADEVVTMVSALIAEPHASADAVDVDRQRDLVTRANPSYFSGLGTDPNTKAKTKQRVWAPARAMLREAARATAEQIGSVADEDGTR